MLLATPMLLAMPMLLALFMLVPMWPRCSHPGCSRTYRSAQSLKKHQNSHQEPLPYKVPLNTSPKVGTSAIPMPLPNLSLFLSPPSSLSPSVQCAGVRCNVQETQPADCSQCPPSWLQTFQVCSWSPFAVAYVVLALSPHTKRRGSLGCYGP